MSDDKETIQSLEQELMAADDKILNRDADLRDLDKWRLCIEAIAIVIVGKNQSFQLDELPKQVAQLKCRIEELEAR